MVNRPAYDWQNAREYIDHLLPDTLRQLQPEDTLPPGVSADTSIGPDVAQLVAVLILAQRPRHVLEIGTSAGYSALVMGKALAKVGGHLLTIEIEPRLAEAARRNLKDVGLADVVEVVVDDANDVLKDLPGPFGLILQDGSKDDYLRMLPRLVDLLEPHGLLITDDVLLPVMDLPPDARRYQYALSLYNDALQGRPELRTVWLPVGDGVALSVRIPESPR